MYDAHSTTMDVYKSMYKIHNRIVLKIGAAIRKGEIVP
jgi:hypothetical protein